MNCAGISVVAKVNDPDNTIVLKFASSLNGVVVVVVVATCLVAAGLFRCRPCRDDSQK